MSYLSDLTGTTGFLDRNPAIDTGLRGTGIGAGAYATMALVREFLDALEDRKAEKKRNKPTIGRDTIVITLPNTVKGASARETLLEYAKIHKKPVEGEDPKSKVRQARNSDGTFARGFDVTLVKDAQEEGLLEGVGRIGLGLAAGAGGLGAGWILAQKVYDYLKQKRLKREIAAAQKEYIDTLMPKEAADVDFSNVPRAPAPTTFINKHLVPEVPKGVGEGAKQTGGAIFGLSLLLAAASSIITKKWLDDRFKDPESASSKPKVKNIVFKSASGDPLECDAVDVLAYAKVASIAMEIPMEKTAGLKDMLKATGAMKKYQDPSVAWHSIFEDLGMSGDDESGWNVVDPKPEGDRQLAWLPFLNEATDEATEAQREAFQNEFMSDKWAKHRQFLARKTINDYMNQYNNSGFGRTWIGQMLSPLFGWIGGGLSNVFANTPWGQRLMLNRMQNTVRARQAAGGATSAAQTAEPSPADTQNTPVAADDKDPFAGSDFAGD